MPARENALSHGGWAHQYRAVSRRPCARDQIDAHHGAYPLGKRRLLQSLAKKDELLNIYKDRIKLFYDKDYEIELWYFVEDVTLFGNFFKLDNNKEYIIIKKRSLKEIYDFPSYFEHDYIANKLLNGKLKKENTVHHIDENKHTNEFNNLIVFETSSDHKRFHTSKYAFVIYNEKTHLFKCINKKE